LLTAQNCQFCAPDHNHPKTVTAAPNGGDVRVVDVEAGSLTVTALRGQQRRIADSG
jgi:hypothetical protein